MTTAACWLAAANVVRELLKHTVDERETRALESVIRILEARSDWEDTDPRRTAPDKTPVLGYVVCPRCGS